MCAGGYDLDAANNKCLKLGANCTAMKSGTTTEECTSCAATHFFRDNKCTTALPLRCATVDSVEFKCKTCQDRSYLVTAENDCELITATNCLKSPDNKHAECTKCASGYFLEGTACKPITVSNCAEGTSATVCTKCKTLISGGGYLLKSDGSKCTFSNGCLLGSNFFLYTGETPQCAQCDIAGNYYATGATGTAAFTLNGKSYWAQSCTKRGNILEIMIVAVAVVVFNF